VSKVYGERKSKHAHNRLVKASSEGRCQQLVTLVLVHSFCLPMKASNGI
jgi:hypothetical protein